MFQKHGKCRFKLFFFCILNFTDNNNLAKNRCDFALMFEYREYQ